MPPKRKAVNDAPASSSTSVPPQKKARKNAKAPKAPPPEKRGAILKKSCPKNILDRVSRVMSQRFFMVDRKRDGQELREEFSVLGSTGNVYTVIIDKKPSCNCPDATKGNHCKHILFIFLKVLQVTQASGFWYQKALITTELEQIFREAPAAPGFRAEARVREAYARATGKAAPEPEAETKKKRLPTEEDDCPVCYENMHKVAEKLLVFCEECGNGLHKECFQQWANTARGDVTCVFCRAKWVVPHAGGKVSSTEGYINLGAVAGINTGRNTGTYYHGPRRGHRYYGYQEYDDEY